jgi:hypothetical protein
MTKNEFVKELKAYFHEWDWRPFDENKVISMLEKFQDKVEPIYILKKVYLEAKPIVNLKENQTVIDAVADEICREHGITIKELKADSPLSCYKDGKKGSMKYVAARRDMCRRVFSTDDTITKTELKEWFGYKCHSSIIHLLNKY